MALELLVKRESAAEAFHYPTNGTSRRRDPMTMIKNFINDEQGASMAEYAMLLALIAVATIGAVTALRNQIVAVFQSSASTLGEAS
jgi:pilus assembly protein Flp/PilA